MGAETKGPPLTFDIGQCMRDASRESYSLEVTGSKSNSCSWDEREQEEGLYSVDVLKERIQRFENLFRTHKATLADNGEKLMRKLKSLHEKLDQHQKQQMTNRHEHKQGNASAFCDSIGILKGVCNNGDSKIGAPEESCVRHVPLGGMRSRGEKGNSSTVVPSSSFYTSSRNNFQESKKDLVNTKHPSQATNSIVSRVASSKRHKTLFPHEKEKSSSLGGTSDGFTRGLRKATLKESDSSQNLRKDSLGASRDTAMELSDDEERGAVDMEAGQQKDLLTHPYSLRSNFEKRGGFRVTYPSGDPEAVEVQDSDLIHLNVHQFLNDTVIDFYVKYLQRPEFLRPERKIYFHFYNTFFFKKLLLEKRKRRKGDYYSKLRKWSRGVNIFEKKYLLVPIHDCAHWSLAIICFARDDDERDVLTPYILHLDSMKDGHVSEEVFQVLRRYLEAEWNHLRGFGGNDESCSIVLKNFVCKRVEVPLQQNAWDCGLFLLYYIERFLHDAKPEFQPSLLESMFGRQWFKPEEASNLRNSIRSILQNLIQELNNEILMEDMD